MIQIKCREQLIYEDIAHIESAFFAKTEIEQLYFRIDGRMQVDGLSQLLTRPLSLALKSDRFLLADIVNRLENLELFVVKSDPIQPLVEDKQQELLKWLYIQGAESTLEQQKASSIAKASNEKQSESVEDDSLVHTEKASMPNSLQSTQPNEQNNIQKGIESGTEQIAEQKTAQSSADSYASTITHAISNIGLATGTGIAADSLNTIVRSNIKQEAVDILNNANKLHADKAAAITKSHTVKALSSIIKTPTAESAKALGKYTAYMKFGSKLPIIGHGISAANVAKDVREAPEDEKLSTGISSGFDAVLSTVTFAVGGFLAAAIGVTAGPLVVGGLFITGGVAASLGYSNFVSDGVKDAVKQGVKNTEGWLESFSSDEKGYKATIKDPANNRH